MWRKLVILAVLAVAAGGGWYAFYREVSPTYELRTEKADRGDITATVTASGKLNAVSVVEVGTQVSGTIREIYVDYNSPVKEGQLIALLDPAVLRLQLVESQASLEVAEAGVGSAAASLTDSQRKLRRGRELYARRLISRSELEDAETSVLLKRAQLQEAKARVTQAKAAVERAQTNLGYTRITSPVDGVIVSRQVDVGQTVAASFQTPTLFSIARDLTQMQIDASVDEADIGHVTEGQDAEFRVDAFPDEPFKGKVVQVRIAPAAADNVVTYTVVIRVDNPRLRLKPGMTASVSVRTGIRESTLRIPAAALRFRPPRDLTLPIASRDAASDGMENLGLNTGTVWLVQEGQLTRRVRVKTGISDGSRVEVLSGDVKEGDDLAVTALPAGTTRSHRLF
ncbi:MAG: efflux RND transporter periplasmic adaptor subunit [Synergistaceae bacterium]|jgi:HlyD family secretion protein|nr:efflux RND transporter periplasmic adaptor subunit [Synergistaceae bacterium]